MNNKKKKPYAPKSSHFSLKVICDHFSFIRKIGVYICNVHS